MVLGRYIVIPVAIFVVMIFSLWIGGAYGQTGWDARPAYIPKGFPIQTLPYSQPNGEQRQQQIQSQNNSNDELPICRYKVVQDCKVQGGITCIIAERDDPCMDIWYGWDGGDEIYNKGDIINSGESDSSDHVSN